MIYVELTVNNEFLTWLNKTYGEDGIGEVKATRGNRHAYLAMILDFSSAKVLKLDMVEYIRRIIKNISRKIRR